MTKILIGLVLRQNPDYNYRSAISSSSCSVQDYYTKGVLNFSKGLNSAPLPCACGSWGVGSSQRMLKIYQYYLTKQVWYCNSSNMYVSIPTTRVGNCTFGRKTLIQAHDCSCRQTQRGVNVTHPILLTIKLFKFIPKLSMILTTQF